MAIDTSIYFGRLGCMIHHHHHHHSIEDNSFQIQQFWVLLLFECPEKETWNILGTSTGSDVFGVKAKNDFVNPVENILPFRDFVVWTLEKMKNPIKFIKIHDQKILHL